MNIFEKTPISNQPAPRASRRPAAVVALLLIAVGAAPALEPAPPSAQAPFPDGTRWVAIGDSISQNGAYAHYVNVFYHTRYPERRIDLQNAGISGDTAAGALRRYDWDILPHRATVATVMLGMNDVGRSNYSTVKPVPNAEQAKVAAMTAYQDTLKRLIERLRADGTAVILLTPSIYDQTGTQKVESLVGVNDALGRCAIFARQEAAARGLGLVEVHQPMTERNRLLQAADPAASIVGADRVHPGHPGHFFLAVQVLQAQGVQPSVAQVAIDGADLRVTRSEHAQVQDLRRTPNGLEFTYRAQSLPFPIPREVAPALAWTDFSAALNTERLAISGLPAGSWTLRIDGKAVGSWAAATWAEGLDLAALPTTPQLVQAQDVARLLGDRRGRMASLRTLAYVEHTTPGAVVPATLEAMEPLIAARVAKLGPEHHYTRQTQTYRSAKPNEKILRQEVESLLQAAQEAAKPRPRTFVVERAAP